MGNNPGKHAGCGTKEQDLPQSHQQQIMSHHFALSLEVGPMGPTSGKMWVQSSGRKQLPFYHRTHKGNRQQPSSDRWWVVGGWAIHFWKHGVAWGCVARGHVINHMPFHERETQGLSAAPAL